MNKKAIYNQMDEKTGYKLPKVWVLWVFLKRGLWNGAEWKIRWSRLFCWIGRHRFRYIEPISRFDCLDCGEQFNIPKNLEEIHR